MISTRRFTRGRAVVDREGFAKELDEEMRFHLEMETAANIEKGMSPDEARREALLAFGGLDRAKEECRDENGLRWLEILVKDVRYGARLLARSPGFTIAAVLTLALSIGANTAIFSFVNAVLLRPLAVAGLDRLVVVYDELPGLNLKKAPMSAGEAADLSQRSDLFEVAAAYREADLTLNGTDETRRVEVTVTMGRFFDLLNARPQLGRLYGLEESQEGRGQVVVLSDAFWRSVAGGDRNIIGSTLDLNGKRYEVIGVLPPELGFPKQTQVWMPALVTSDALQARMRLDMSFVGRLRPGIAPEQLSEQLGVEASRWHERFPDGYKSEYGHTLVGEPLVDSLAGPLRPILLVLMAAVVLVLLIACANLASLQMVRATGRWKELAVRTALGAGRGSIIRQLLTESLVLAMLGGIAGLLLGLGLVRLLSGWSAVQQEALKNVQLDPNVLAFTLVITLLAALLLGLIPAFRASRVDPQDVLKESAHNSSGGAPQQRLLQAGVVIQFALALTLLLASGLTLASLARLIAVDPGFQAERVTTMKIGTNPSNYPNGIVLSAFYDRLLERLGGIPDFEAAGLVGGLPFSGDKNSSPFAIEGREKRSNEPERHANIRLVAGDYFRAMGIPLLRGRMFNRSDAPLRLESLDLESLDPSEFPRISVIIDESMAKKYFDGEDPIGKVIQHAGPPGVIVGVVGAVRDGELGQEAYPTVYYWHPQLQWGYPMSLVVRSSFPSESVAELARATLQEIDPSAVAFDIAPMEDLIGRSLGSRRLAMAVLTGFAGLALLLAVIGIYGVISHGVSQRRHEIGIRIALGARPGAISGMILRNGLAMVAVGAVLGTLLFLGVWRGLSSLVYGVEPNDPWLLCSGIALLGAVAAFASYWPARRAAGVRPMEALRAE